MTTVKENNWIQTFTGKKFYPFNPKIEDIDISDIAQSLSNQCRFAGHSISFYSVAQHSVFVSLMCNKEDALWGLLHDASESYLVDVPSPLKHSVEFEAYRKIEHKLMNVICECYGLQKQEPESVILADKRILITEARDLTLSEGRGWKLGDYEPYDFHIKAWTPEVSRIKFLRRFHELVQVKGK